MFTQDYCDRCGGCGQEEYLFGVDWPLSPLQKFAKQLGMGATVAGLGAALAMSLLAKALADLDKTITDKSEEMDDDDQT